MPNRPSKNGLANTVSLYKFKPTRTADLGVAANPYVLLQANVACSVQPAQPDRLFDGETMKVAEKGAGDIFFDTVYSLAINDKAVWVDTAGQSHDLYITGIADQAGKGAAFVANYEERLK